MKFLVIVFALSIGTTALAQSEVEKCSALTAALVKEDLICDRKLEAFETVNRCLKKSEEICFKSLTAKDPFDLQSDYGYYFYWLHTTGFGMACQKQLESAEGFDNTLNAMGECFEGITAAYFRIMK